VQNRWTDRHTTAPDFHKSPPICINLLRASLCAGGGVRGLVVLAAAGVADFSAPVRGEKIYNMVTFD
jgi:hypothetical protein